MESNQFSSSKILKHIDRISEWQEKGVSRPITYELDMTNVCNSKCHFCFGFFDQKNNQVSINLKEAKNILNQIKKFGGKAVTFTGGGDPLCNKDTVAAVKHAKKLGLDVGFITNGILLNKDNVKDIVSSCVWIRVSLDAATKETYLKTHCLNSNVFESVVSNIKLLSKEKKKQKNNITIGVGFLTYDRTIDEIIDFAKLASKLGVDYAQYRPLLKKHTEKEFNTKTQDIVIEKIKEAYKYSNKTFSVVSSMHKYKLIASKNCDRQYDICYGHNFATVIAADKKMYLCCHMRGVKKYCIGDLNKNTLKEIWCSKQREKVYKNIDFKDCPLLCRCDSFNTILFNMQKPVQHTNFL
ncbi:MAG: radical SAM protein [Endomicrobiaceae bacterium]|nr:radical SAM protein [Endomicrobiaceae bacterium]